MTGGLRILMPSIYFPPRVGGIESHVYSLAKELVRRGNSVRVITTRTEATSPARETLDGIVVERLQSFGRHPLGWTASSAFFTPRVVAVAPKCDLVHCHTFAAALSGSVASVLSGRPLVVTLHSSHYLRMVRKPLMRPVLRLLLRRARLLLSTSKEIDGATRDLLPGRRTLPIVNGIDTEAFRPVPGCYNKEPGEFLIVCPRRLVQKNGVEFLIRALPLVGDRVRTRVLVAGDGPLRASLGGLADRLGVARQVVFMGSVENATMPALFSSANLVVIPSLVEATSIAALEAMACERPVAASRVGGLPEIIDEKVGILFEPGSPQAIAEAVVDAAARGDLATLGREARRRVEARWSIGRVAEYHEQLYRDVLAALGKE